ncbi:MAG: 16S rRNA (uracil(1498)-N(3))-methyltransferase [Saprospiraceae bacterium]|nr:16S rRNA (uracil(1498)-N(3))-methyltransferase [Saprospiraceae bacterium]
MQLFFSKNIKNGIAQLDEVEARHAVQVLRRKVGDAMQLTDGEGHLYDGTIIEIGKKNCLVGINSTIEAYNERPFRVHIAIAPTKNIDRFEWFLEKATEIGVDEITPLICKRSEREVIKWDRLNGVLLSAMKQSLKTYLPKLNEAIDFQKFMKRDFSTSQNFIAHCIENTEKQLLSKMYKLGQNCVILIGPEGDFTEGEVAAALQQNFFAVSLGNSRLRTETAGVVACHTINLLNE